MPRRSSRKSGNDRVEPRFDEDLPAIVTRPRKPRKSPVRKKKKSKSIVLRFLGWCFSKMPRMAYWTTVLGLWGFIGALCTVGWYGAQLPNAGSWEVPQRPPNVRIVGNDGVFMLNRGVGGTAMQIDDMSPWLPQAVMAIEDRRFHYHFGFDPIGFTRAMVTNVMARRMRQGGSTLTQQLAKNLFLKPERTFARKVQELILAIWLETKYSKEEIMEMYLNRVYFGAGAWGVDAASRRYFGKSASKINLQEAAMIAGLLKAPSAYSPASHPKRAKARTKLVLASMVRDGYIKPEDVKPEAKPVITTSYYRAGPEHYVADMVMKEVKKLIPKVDRDITVETTISPYLMTAAQGVVQTALRTYSKKKRVSQAAMVSLAPDGAIRAVIGGRNYGKSQFNRAIDAKRQPGSAFKTFVWQAALEHGYRPNSILVDEPVRVGRWTPENYDRRYRGEVTLGDAFAKSLNTIAVKLVGQTGSKRVAATARRMGISTELERNASLALGTSEVSLMELTAAYAPYSNGGIRAKPYMITRIVDRKGKILYKRGKRPRIRVVEPETLGLMNGMLHQVTTRGTGKAAKIKGHFAGGKTGTSQNSRDAWFIGHTAHLVTGVWFGNDNNKPTKKLTGGSLPAKAWASYMSAAHQGLEKKMLPGDDFILATLPAALPAPKSRPRLASDPKPSLRERVFGSLKRSRDRTVTGDVQKRRTILDIIFGSK